tara:strand:+ start:573 stop:1673 length:1101 start_codon:yes stop_codon:yes gene_type:complete
MSTLKINIVLFGIGNVGSVLIEQVLANKKFSLEKQNIELNFPIVTNSTLALFEKDGLGIDWKDDFANSAIPYKLEDIIEYVKLHQLENLIAIDASTSSDFVASYIPLVENGFHIVAANKKANTLDYVFYKDLRKTFKKYDKTFMYETNVGASLPVVQTISDLHLSGEKITKIRGVFSGSLSYIFNRFSEEEISFSEVLIEAENRGYTEPDSREDLSGSDVARKLLILARELDQVFEFSDVQVTSLLLPNLNETHSKSEYAINKLLFDKPFEIAKITQNKNHVLRYVGEFDVESKKLEVKLVSVPKSTALGQLKGADNLIEIYAKSYGEIPIVIQGAGAGKQVTARGILIDILKITDKIKNKQPVFL